MAESTKLDHRAITVNGTNFRFRIKRLQTEFQFADGSVHVFPNWDVKGLRERFFMDEYVNVPVEQYLQMAADSGEIVEHGLKTSDIRKFIEKKFEYFEDLILGSTGDIRLDDEENL
jgi:hypothetical protein